MATRTQACVYAADKLEHTDYIRLLSPRTAQHIQAFSKRAAQLLQADHSEASVHAAPPAQSSTTDQEVLMRGNDTGASASAPSGDDEPPQNVTYRSLLRNRSFRMLWLGEAISTFGSLFTRLAVPVYVYNITNSPTQLGLSVFFSLVATLLFGLVSGVLVDRWDRRRSMIAANLLNGVVLLVLAGVVLGDPPLPVRLAAIYALSFIAALLRDFFAAARVAIFPDIITKQEYLTANALDQSTIQFAELLSYPLSILVLWLGPSLAFGLDAGTFFVSAALLTAVTVSRAPVQRPPENTILRDIAAGLRTVRQLDLVRKVVVLSFVVPTIFSLMFTLQLLYAVKVAGSTDVAGFPLLEGAMALGFVVGALLLGRWGKHTSRGRLLAYGLAGMGVALALQGMLPYLLPWLGLPTVLEAWRPWTPLLLVATLPVLLSGITNSWVSTGIRTIVQEQTPQAALGRVFSVIQVAASFGFALGALLTIFVNDHVPLILISLGSMLVVLGLVCRTWLTSGETPPVHNDEVNVRA
jgi:MFS family permease